MPSKTEYHAAMEQVQAYADDFNMETIDVISEDIERKTEKEESEPKNEKQTQERIYLILEDRNRTIYVVGQQNWKFFAIQYPINFVDFIASGLPEEDINSILGEDDVKKATQGENGTSKPTLAAKEVITNTDDEAIKSLRNYLRNIGSGTYAEFQSESSEETPLATLSVVAYIFPYEKDFSLRKFSDKAMEVMISGQRLSDVLSLSIGLARPENDEGEYRLDIEPALF